MNNIHNVWDPHLNLKCHVKSNDTFPFPFPPAPSAFPGMLCSNYDPRQSLQMITQTPRPRELSLGSYIDSLEPCDLTPTIKRSPSDNGIGECSQIEAAPYDECKDEKRLYPFFNHEAMERGKQESFGGYKAEDRLNEARRRNPQDHHYDSFVRGYRNLPNPSADNIAERIMSSNMTSHTIKDEQSPNTSYAANLPPHMLGPRTFGAPSCSGRDYMPNPLSFSSHVSDAASNSSDSRSNSSDSRVNINSTNMVSNLSDFPLSLSDAHSSSSESHHSLNEFSDDCRVSSSEFPQNEPSLNRFPVNSLNHSAYSDNLQVQSKKGKRTKLDIPGRGESLEKIGTKLGRNYSQPEEFIDRDHPNGSHTSVNENSNSSWDDSDSVDSDYDGQDSLRKRQALGLDFDTAHDELVKITKFPKPSVNALRIIRTDDPNLSDHQRDYWGDFDIDTSQLTFDQIMRLIHPPEAPWEITNPSILNEFLKPHEVGHINHIFKSFIDAMLSIEVPDKLLDKPRISPTDCIDLHLCGVLQVFFIAFKSKDFASLEREDQLAMIEANMFPALICLSLPHYKQKTRSWHVPSPGGKPSSLMMYLDDFIQLLDFSSVGRSSELYDLCLRFDIDLTMSTLMFFIFLYTPINRDIIQMDVLDDIRDKYVNILAKYSQFKYGPRNFAKFFQEILKIMDLIIRHSKDIQNYPLKFTDSELLSLEEKIYRLQEKGHSFWENSIVSGNDVLSLKKDEVTGLVTFATLQSNLCEILTKSFRLFIDETVDKNRNSSSSGSS